jgi:hypothetical protein
VRPSPSRAADLDRRDGAQDRLLTGPRLDEGMLWNTVTEFYESTVDPWVKLIIERMKKTILVNS